MPLLFSQGQHRALVSVQAQEGERLLAFLYVVCSPGRVGEVHNSGEGTAREDWHHHGKTKPSMTDALTCAAWVVKPEAVVWRGDWALLPSQQGLRVLGVQIGHPSFITAHMAAKLKEQALLFKRNSGVCCSFSAQPREQIIGSGQFPSQRMRKSTIRVCCGASAASRRWTGCPRTHMRQRLCP